MTDEAAERDAQALGSWSSLSTIEQSLMRRGLRQRYTAGIIQAHGMALRWEGLAGAPLTGGYSHAELRIMVPEFAETAARLIAQGVLELRQASKIYIQDTDPPVTPEELKHVLRDPATWIWDAEAQNPYWLAAPQSARRAWYRSAFFADGRSDYPAWSELSEPQQRILLSASEASGMLTGPWGIWSQPEPGLDPSQRLIEIYALLEPLLPLVRDALLEVQYREIARTDMYTVIPLNELRSAFNGTEIWRDDEDADFFDGAHAVFTHVGYATWHAPHDGG